MNTILMIAVMMLSAALSASLPMQNFDYNDLITNDLDGDIDPVKLTDYLLYLLSAPSEAEYPLVVLQDDFVPPDSSMRISKRSRYYRRYPWKRQQNNGIYEPDNYLCTPTRDDVFQLLIALHEARSGNMEKTVSFCNRRRPARAILTSMRFIGKR
ncbi:Hypothetical protein NTJ_01520 [Nesidiocoris tenuis]|uniref:Uncharacterized protein n=1 Tax=Nesidiocoris tenuis TaxID=355587 RepID=A0ABN7A9P6_9HEMI|nr:Hypothetical protein NTJ_01520 [Nesidiocoris tenuis]